MKEVPAPEHVDAVLRFLAEQGDCSPGVWVHQGQGSAFDALRTSSAPPGKLHVAVFTARSTVSSPSYLTAAFATQAWTASTWPRRSIGFQRSLRSTWTASSRPMSRRCRINGSSAAWP